MKITQENAEKLFSEVCDKVARLNDEIATLKSQLANIKYLNAGEVEHIIGSINTNQEKVQAICNLAIDIDRDKIIEVLDSRFKTQLRMYLIELYSVTGKLTEKQENDIKDYMKKSADEIIKAIRKD